MILENLANVIKVDKTTTARSFQRLEQRKLFELLSKVEGKIKY